MCWLSLTEHEHTLAHREFDIPTPSKLERTLPYKLATFRSSADAEPHQRVALSRDGSGPPRTLPDDSNALAAPLSFTTPHHPLDCEEGASHGEKEEERHG